MQAQSKQTVNIPINALLEQYQEQPQELIPSNDAALAVYYDKLGRTYFAQHRHQEAIEASSYAIDLTPDNSTYYANLAASFLAQGQYFKARKLYIKAKELDPHNSSYGNMIGVTYYLEKNYELAIFAFESTLYNIPTTGSAEERSCVYYNMGSAYMCLKNFGKAIEFLETACSLYPANALYHSAISTAYLAIQNYPEAATAIYEAIKIDAANSLYWLKYGNIIISYVNTKIIDTEITDIGEQYQLTQEAILCYTNAGDKGNHKIIEFCGYHDHSNRDLLCISSRPLNPIEPIKKAALKGLFKLLYKAFEDQQYLKAVESFEQFLVISEYKAATSCQKSLITNQYSILDMFVTAKCAVEELIKIKNANVRALSIESDLAKNIRSQMNKNMIDINLLKDKEVQYQSKEIELTRGYVKIISNMTHIDNPVMTGIILSFLVHEVTPNFSILSTLNNIIHIVDGLNLIAPETPETPEMILHIGNIDSDPSVPLTGQM